MLQSSLHDRVKQLGEDCETALIHRHNPGLGHPSIPLHINARLDAPRKGRPRGRPHVLELGVHLRVLAQDLGDVRVVLGKIRKQGRTFLGADGTLKRLRSESILLLKDRSPAGQPALRTPHVCGCSRNVLGCIDLRPPRQSLIREHQTISCQFNRGAVGRCQIVHKSLVLDETRAGHRHRELQGGTAARGVGGQEPQPRVLGEPLDLGGCLCGAHPHLANH
mmetsp:Transcript_38990/g.93590  ORF Transcript_38990/g.93590 Transcript_38990/m.93590 type:complete len:221 (-) Transcript_38990:1137-1799(-)